MDKGHGIQRKKTLIGNITSEPHDSRSKQGDKVRVTLKEIEDVH